MLVVPVETRLDNAISHLEAAISELLSIGGQVRTLHWNVATDIATAQVRATEARHMLAKVAATLGHTIPHVRIRPEASR